MKPKRPFEVKLFVITLLLWSLIGWLRLRETITFWNLLTHTITIPGPEYLALSGAAWGGAGLAGGVGLWLRLNWARYTAFAAAGFVLWYWVERLVTNRSNAGWSNMAFTIVLSVLWLAFAFVAIGQAERKGYFKKEGNGSAPL
jgi:hypothetical protein